MIESGFTPDVRLAEPVPRTALRGLRRQVTILWHGVIAWAFAPGWLSKVILTAVSLGLIVYPLLKAGLWKHTAAYGAVWVLIGFWKAYRELTPKNIQLVQRQYLERKLMLFRLIRDLENRSNLTESEVAGYRREVLQLIANYVRAHRCDFRGTTIYANLLVERDGFMRVVARDRDHRDASPMIPSRCSLAWTAIATGSPKITGDVYADYPETPPGKDYRSILVIPITRPQKVIGAVSIDSTRRYHFDREMKNLVEFLRPYVALLEWTLDPGGPKVENAAPSEKGNP